MSSAAPQPPRDDRSPAAGWAARRTYSAAAFSAERLAAHKRERVTAILPAREVAATIGAILERLAPLRALGLIDELVVVDASSADGTAEIAAATGATVLQERELLPAFGPPLGKGDAMWRALSATEGELVVFLDTDTEGFDPAFATGLLGPLIEQPEIVMVKGAYRRPFSGGGVTTPEGGGRVNELVARPFLNLFVPELAGVAQPLAGEVAARRAVLERIPFPVGYGVEIAMLIDVARGWGADAIAQSDLGTRQNAHQPLRELAGMAVAVLATAARRVFGTGGGSPEAASLLLPLAPGELEPREIRLEERPPLTTLRR